MNPAWPWPQPLKWCFYHPHCILATFQARRWYPGLWGTPGLSSASLKAACSDLLGVDVVLLSVLGQRAFLPGLPEPQESLMCLSQNGASGSFCKLGSCTAHCPRLSALPPLQRCHDRTRDVVWGVTWELGFESQSSAGLSGKPPLLTAAGGAWPLGGLRARHGFSA